jgi:hypothetical protein
MNRRNVLALAGLSPALVLAGCKSSAVGSSVGHEASERWLTQETISVDHDFPNLKSRLPELLTLERVKPKGQWSSGSVPDTLDLTNYAQFSINVLTNDTDPSQFYGVWQGFEFVGQKPSIVPNSLTWNLTARRPRTLPMLRLMTGSTYKLDAELEMMHTIINQIAPDGDVPYPVSVYPSNPPKGTSYPQINGGIVFAMLNCYFRDGKSDWVSWMSLIAEGLRKDAIRVGDRAYYPMQSGIDGHGEWHYMFEGMKVSIPYHTPEEPASDQQGNEGAAKSDQDRAFSALMWDYRLTGNKESLDVAERVVRETLRPAWWDDTSADGYPGYEHGIWSGHFHNNAQTLIALLGVAQTTENPWLKQFVKEGYDNAIRNGVVRIGWFPSWTEPEKYNRPKWLHSVTEGCAVANVAELAVLLSDAGLGDYWDDVDSITRNHLVEQQVNDLSLMRKVSGTNNDTLLKRFMGGFGNAAPTGLNRQCSIAGCCSGNCAHALYYAWHGITRFDGSLATINLFLNRVSPWMDIDSYVPYKGKVVLHNKTAKAALVRIPSWVEIERVRSRVNGVNARPARAGRHLLFDSLHPSDVVELEFPMEMSTDRYGIADTEYTVTFKGSTVVDITPRETDSDVYPLYRRSRYRQNKAPIVEVRRFISDKLIPLGTY